MNTKLTLNLNRDTVEDAGYYARTLKTGLSKLIENYLNTLTGNSSVSNKTSPLVKSLTGVIPDAVMEERKNYRDYLDKKYS
ncbi:MAG: DUF6364 family protein [Prevotella sp.]|jgi:hypothetical protein|nr:DUF6364 family protein [Prevotella sp.]